MKLGFVTAILPDLSFEDVLKFAADHGFGCVEVMCWPVGEAERRYAGVTHIDVTNFGPAEAANVKALMAKYGVSISGLGYYPNPLVADPAERTVYAEHIKKVIAAAKMIDVPVMNTFVGRDPARSIEDQWPLFEEVWAPLIAFAEQQDVKIGIENCPMLFSLDEWPGGKNLAISPDVWRRMFDRFPSRHFGLNFDPSHLIWQHIDYVRAIHEFGSRFVHVHAKDEKIDPDRLYDRGILGLKWHTPKLPGLGSVNWGAFYSALSDTGYDYAVCIEVEDRAYEGSLDDRKRSLTQSKRFLEQFMY
ncbi:MAG: sugar phosphate isomerase/epimerase [Chloroflexi bacterium]|nr:sugar phosphate isomerase/epimerase [Chloroflexota bacterium]